jgi:2-(3-amino-3-carboxypropyl)histidine synthase
MEKRRLANQIPESILSDPVLAVMIKQLPSNYNFEVQKTIWKVQQSGAKTVALQLPEGLLMFACVLSDILEYFCKVETMILGDVTYGACCVDDLSAIALGADFMVHYGHSCLVPIDATSIKMLYVFVEISIDVDHFVACVLKTLPPTTKLAVMGTVQFASAFHASKPPLTAFFDHVHIPQAKPLSPGEVLGCTSPKIEGCEVLVFVADGRFHLEAAMIQNPELHAYRYDPYAKQLTREYYDTGQMHTVRRDAIDKARGAKRFGVILGTLGRQGNPFVLSHVESLMKKHGKEYFVLLLSEIFPGKLAAFKDVDAWIQIACPRLSVDWGYAFDKPLLSPYEAEVTLDATQWREIYPMDFYSKDSGPWTNYHSEHGKRIA